MYASAVAVLILASVVSAATETRCPFLPADVAPPITYNLPAKALATPLLDLPLQFHGIHPILTRRDVPFGSVPKVIVLRYSAAPSIVYDDSTRSVVITSAACSADSSTSSSSSSSLLSTPRSTRWMTLTAATVLMGLVDERSRPLVTASMALLLGASTGAFGGVEAATRHTHHRFLQETCVPTVEVVVEAPLAYQGAVATCLAEIMDPIVCPDPFPTYPTSSNAAPQCGLAVVGAGAGGLYTALRMVDEQKVAGADVCVFEMTERVGGRLMSLRGLGPESDLAVDAGGYRTRPEFTPTLHALITDYLGIPMECYDDSDPCTVFTIVDSNGKKAGFATFIEEMMKRLIDAGASFYPFHELKSLAQIESGGEKMTELRFANGVVATASLTTVLNLPQKPLFSVIRNSRFDDIGLIDAPTLDALHSVQSVIATKLYLYYPRGHVFWRKLGLTSGDFEFAGDARNMLLGGRYHDGQVECTDEADVDTCHGFLLAVYVNDLSGNKAQFFRRYQRERPEPVTIISNTDLEGAEFLKHAHSRLEQYHLYEAPNGTFTGSQAQAVFASTSPPTFAVLSTWSADIPWAGGAWHMWTDVDNVDMAMQPFVDDNIFVVNEAYSLLHGWAEGSLKLGDQVLESYFGISRPWNFTATDIVQTVAQTDSRECIGDSGDSTGSGSGGAAASSGSGGASAGSGSAAESVLCFTSDAMVEMVGGGFKKLSDVRVGDLVATGYEQGVGLVSQVLMHPVGDTVPVAVMRTKQHGELVGTPSHPILHDNQWMELGDVSGGVTLERRYIDVFYNLEIDGHMMEDSTHSYVVNGVVASGLGDNEALNRHFQRQTVWKTLVLNDKRV